MTKEYLFYVPEVDEAEEDTPVLIVSREYWDENHAIESVHLMDTLDDLLPPCIVDEMEESSFISEFNRDDTKEAMERQGFIWEPALATAGEQT